MRFPGRLFRTNKRPKRRPFLLISRGRSKKRVVQTDGTGSGTSQISVNTENARTPVMDKPGPQTERGQTDGTRFGGMPESETVLLGSELTTSLETNLDRLEEIFHAPKNSEFATRRLSVSCADGSTDAIILYCRELVEPAIIEDALISPVLNTQFESCVPEDMISYIRQNTISSHSLAEAQDFGTVTEAIVDGKTVFLLDGAASALVVHSQKLQHRSIVESPTEAVVRGPHTGFVENLGVNIALLKSLLKTPDLVVERFHIGARSAQTYGLVYIEGIANPAIIEEMKKRLRSISADWVGAGVLVNRFIEDEPRNPVPTTMLTERPDRMAAALCEGHIGIIGESPTAVLAPATIWQLMHTSEDYYIHMIPSSLIRIVRWIALFLTIYVSPLYVAIATYHHEMLPTELAFSIAAAREGVPMPAAIEAFMLELGFELIREGGIRIPSIIGPTIGIVGAVILGQAAVQARIVSAILVVIVAASGLGAFAVPNYDMGLVARIAKLVILLSASVFGIPGVVFVSMVLLARLLKMSSFGVPFTSPVLPWTAHAKDLMVRELYPKMRIRPQFLKPLDKRRRAQNQDTKRR